MENNQSSFVNNQSSTVNNKYRVVFFGTPSFVDPIINVLQKNFDLVAVIRNEEQYNSLVNNQSSIINNVDFFVVASFGQILPKEVLDIPKIAAINIHPSLLPKYRGPSPIQTAILNGEKITGVSIIKMDEKMDHGPIIEQFEEVIESYDTFESLAKRLFEKCTNTLVRVLTEYDKIEPRMQDESKATYTKLLKREDGYIDVSKPPKQLSQMIRAFYSWPGVWTRSSIVNNQSSIIKFLPEQKLQVEGRRPMSYKDFINGYPNGENFLRKINLITN